jgi:hypothetical protein
MNTANGGSFATGSQARNNIYWNSPSGGLPSDYDLCNSSCGETNGQTYSSNDLFTNYASQNYHLARATTAWQSLGAPYNVDYDGKTRGSDGLWDRGAYEFNGTTATPNPPTNLTGTTH